MKYCRTVFLLFLLPFLCVILTSPFLRSMFFLSAWEQLQDMETFRNGNILPIRVQIPGGWNTLEDDWFPLVSTFRADELFQEWSGEEGIELTILYNFPSFSTASNQDSGGCCSHLFDPASGYYNSFYGAYIVRRADGSPYGFTLPESKDTDAKSSDIKVSDALPIINMKEAALLPYFDYQMLVFRGFGLSTDDFRFEWTVNDLNAPVSYLGIGGWTRIQAELTVSRSFSLCSKRLPSLSPLWNSQRHCAAIFRHTDVRLPLWQIFPRTSGYSLPLRRSFRSGLCPPLRPVSSFPFPDFLIQFFQKIVIFC
ncbi:MAG: hypothetical protein V8S32_01915 [Lachnospiraceae bacterium]